MLEHTLASPDTGTTPCVVVHKASDLTCIAFYKSALEHIYILPSMLLILAVFITVITFGSGNLFEKERMGLYYFAQASSILEGRLDIPPEAIAYESHERGGRHYGYFGVAPALLRIPLLKLFPQSAGCWGRIMMTLACLLTLIHLYLILLKCRDIGGERGALTFRRKICYSAFILTTGLGSTLIFLSSHAFIYHEAILWASTFTLIFCFHFLSFARNPTICRLWILFFFAAMAFFSRASSGAATLMILLVTAILILFPELAKRLPKDVRLGNLLNRIWDHSGLARQRSPFVFSGVIITFLFAVSLAHLLINYGKFGKLCLQPTHETYHIMREYPRRLKNMQGQKYLGPTKWKTTLSSYFGVQGNLLSSRFPFVQLSTEYYEYDGEHMDHVEAFASIPEGQTCLALLAILGVGFTLCKGFLPKALRIPLVGTLFGGTVLLLSASVSYRYVHDFYVFLTLAAIGGVYLIGMLAKRIQLLLVILLVPLGLFNAYTNIFFALEYKLQEVGGVSVDKRVAYHQFLCSMSKLGLGSERKDYRGWQFLNSYRKAMLGKIWKTEGSERIYVWGGSAWVPLKATNTEMEAKGRISFQILSFPFQEDVNYDPNDPRLEPIIAVGPPERSCVLFVAYYPGNRIAFGYGQRDQMGEGGQVVNFVHGEPFEVPVDVFMTLQVNYENESQRLLVYLDKVRRFEHRCIPSKSEYYQVRIGGNLFDPRIAGSFCGYILPLGVESENHEDSGTSFFEQYPYLYHRDKMKKERMEDYEKILRDLEIGKGADSGY